MTCGFTIIEVILFLGISGLMALTLLGGWTTMINTQRYKDSVKTVQSFLQQQYNLVYNVEIVKNADGGPYCLVNGSGDPEFVTTATPRGQSDCVQMGRLVVISGGVNIRSYAIVGADIANDTSTTDTQSILSRNPKIVQEGLTLTDSELIVPWQAEISQPRAAGAGQQNVALAIIRSPLTSTGAVHTYVVGTDGTNLPDLEDMIDTANERQATLCMNPDTFFSGTKIGVAVQARASAQSFVQIIQDDSTC